MNPELERNLWVELTPRRIALMAVVLGLIFLAAFNTEGNELKGVGQAAQILFYIIVVFWGTRVAASSVVGEIRDRTWDGQRLSALTPWQMLIGKLVGATSYQWFGGLVCLALIAVHALFSEGPGAMLAGVLYFLAIGLFAQSASLFASLLAIRRRASHTRFDVFLYQLAGLIVAGIVASLWDIDYVSRVMSFDLAAGEGAALVWYGQAYPAEAFKLVSLFAFLGWSLMGNLSLLRSELQVRTGPLPWLGFVLFVVAYVAGFGSGLNAEGAGETTVRLAMAIQAAALLTYAAILIEPKDPVLYRWFLGALGRGRLDQAFGALQAWMSSFAVLTGLVVYFLLTFEAPKVPETANIFSDFLPFDEWFANFDRVRPIVIAAYFFVARDIAIFLFFNFAPGARRGDFGAIVTLAVLYIVFPAILSGFGGTGLLALFYPGASSHAVLTVVAPAVEAALVWLVTIGRLSRLLAPLDTALARR